MGDKAKYDIFMNELIDLEKQVQKFVVENSASLTEITNLKEKISTLEKENEVLVLKIKELEKKLHSAEEEKAVGDTVLDVKDREELKSQIDELISRIDYHIRS